MDDRTSIQLSKDTREELRAYQLPGESADDAVSRLIGESEPPSFGVDAAEAERIAERVADRKIEEVAHR